MIEALDETIKQLLIQKMPLNLAEVDVSFDVPSQEWSRAISKPTINIYLHDIRENVELRTNEWLNERGSNGRITKTKFGRRMDLSYLVTAWTSSVEDEHRLLWYVLATLMRFPVLPGDILQGPLVNQAYPLQTKVAQPDSILRNAADVWTALDNQLKPVLPYVITLSLDSYIMEITSEVRNKFLRFYPPAENGLVNPLTPAERSKNNGNGNGNGLATLAPVVVSQHLQIGGHITSARNSAQAVRAEVVLVEQGLHTRTDSDGRYSFSFLVERPQYTFLIVAPGYSPIRQVLPVPAVSYDFELEPETS